MGLVQGPSKLQGEKRVISQSMDPTSRFRPAECQREKIVRLISPPFPILIVSKLTSLSAREVKMEFESVDLTLRVQDQEPSRVGAGAREFFETILRR